MSVEQFIEKFGFAIEVEPSTLTPETNYRELSVWDSLNALSLIALADAEYGVALSGNDIESAATINDIWNMIETRR